jgi:putative phosphoribosyl transferase
MPTTISTRQVEISPLRLPGVLNEPAKCSGVVAFAHGSGSSRFSPRNVYVAEQLNKAGLGALLFDLLTAEEADDRAKVFDIPLLSERLGEAVSWLRRDPETSGLPIGLFGASTGAAAALNVAAARPGDISAVVSRGGRPDLCAALAGVRAPTLLLVGGYDAPVIGLNESALDQLTCEKRLMIIPGATHLFEEPGTLYAVVRAARDWFVEKLTAGSRKRS